MRNFLIITIGFVLVSSHVFSQEVQAKLSKKTVQVGEPFTLNFEIVGTANYSIGSLGKKKRLAVLKQSKKKGTPDTSYIELTDKFNSKTEKIQGRFYWQGAFELIAFEEGVFVIPPMTFRSDKGKNIESNPFLISFVSSNLNLSVKEKQALISINNLRDRALETLKYMVSAGNGATLVPQLCMDAWTNHGDDKIAYIPITTPKQAREISFLARSGSAYWPCVEALHQVMSSVMPEVSQDTHNVPVLI